LLLKIYHVLARAAVLRSIRDTANTGILEKFIVLANFKNILQGYVPTFNAGMYGQSNSRLLGLNIFFAAAARAHAVDQATNNLFTHVGSDGSSSAVRAARAGFTGLMIAEIGTQGTPTAAASRWMNSAGHRTVMLSPGRDVIGVGVADGVIYSKLVISAGTAD
jgi:hypothetical protein